MAVADTDLDGRLAKALRKERKAAERRAQRIETDLTEAERTSELQRHGELLKVVIGDVRPGMSEMVAVDPATGEEVAIPLDPALSPRENLEATFKRYQKLIRRLTKAGAQADEARAALDRIGALQALLERAREQGAEAVEALAASDAAARLLRKHGGARPAEGTLPSKRPRKGPFEGLPRRLHPRRYRSADGLEIWVGRSDECNDYLSTRLARGRDLFFHLDGAPGSQACRRPRRAHQEREEAEGREARARGRDGRPDGPPATRAGPAGAAAGFANRRLSPLPSRRM